MTKRTASTPASLAQISADSLRHVTGGEETKTTKPPYMVTFKWQPETIEFSKSSG